MGKFRCPNLHDNEYGKEVCRFTNCPCDCSCRSECTFSTCFDHETDEDD